LDEHFEVLHVLAADAVCPLNANEGLKSTPGRDHAVAQVTQRSFRIDEPVGR
jgi:hypothetical protein